MKASVRIKNVKYPIILTGLVVEFVDTVVVHIQRICNIRSHLGPDGHFVGRIEHCKQTLK